MTKTFRTSASVLALCFAALLTACSAPNSGGAGKTGAEAAESAKTNAAAALDALAAEVWDWDLEQNYAARLQLGLPIVHLADETPEAINAAATRAEGFLARLSAIDAGALDYERTLTRSYIERYLSEIAAAPKSWIYTFAVTPYAGGLTLSYVRSYAGAVALETEEQRANYLTFVNEFADLVEQSGAKVLIQAEAGIRLPKPALNGARALFKGLSADAQAFRPSIDRLSALSDAERGEFLSKVDAVITDRLAPAYDKVLAILGPDYEAAAPEAVGIGQYPGGHEEYRRRILIHTSYAYTPEEIHEYGLRRMAEIQEGMAAIREELGFKGTKAEFNEMLRTNPRFLAKSPEEVEERYNSYIARIEPLIPDYFSVLPKAPYGVKRLDTANEAGQTFGYYQLPDANEPRGLYRYNGSHLESRSLVGAGPLIYHELVPGHHFQQALQRENGTLPDIRRYTSAFSLTGYVEGWAEYGASLAEEMGLYSDPYDQYGRLVMESFLVSRLVVDTGMNEFGWPLEKARAYMRENTFQSDLEIASETLRYSTDLYGQALAYKMGHRRLLELRAKAQADLGDKFDIRDFHAAVLSEGALPLDILEGHLAHWEAEALAKE